MGPCPPRRVSSTSDTVRPRLGECSTKRPATLVLMDRRVFRFRLETSFYREMAGGVPVSEPQVFEVFVHSYPRGPLRPGLGQILNLISVYCESLEISS